VLAEGGGGPVKLAFRTVEAEGDGAGAVLVHGQGAVPVDELIAFARRGGLTGPLVVPFGDYATTASGMEVAGPCWYRSLPGDAGTDPLTLTRAVVQLTDLMSESALDRPVLVGWRQGAAVALGAGLLAPLATAGVIAVDVPSSHLCALPAALSVGGAAPPVLLAASGAVDGVDPASAVDELGRRGMVAEVVSGPAGKGSDAVVRENGEALADAIGVFVARATGRAGAQGGTRTT
jgi:pimeloyl-ACP methyl ester carboxylesterase